MIPYLLVISLIGIFILLSLRKRFIIDYALPYPSGTASGVLINSLHSIGNKTAERQVWLQSPMHLPCIPLHWLETASAKHCILRSCGGVGSVGYGFDSICKGCMRESCTANCAASFACQIQARLTASMHANADDDAV